MRPVGWVLLLGLGLVLTAPQTAQADSAQPTNYRSEVTEVAPPAEGVSFEVAGGDTFLTVTVESGTEVEIPGYEGEPYVRVSGDGQVEVNRNSPSRWVNEDRFARTGIPSHASAEATPDWEVVASDGSYGWHDHRIHWMSPEPPPAVDRESRSKVFDWVVPVIVNDEPVDVMGTLEWVPDVSPIPWALVGVAVAAVSYLAGLSGWALLVGAGLASAVGAAEAAASPLGLWAEYMAWVPPVLGLAVVAVGLARPAYRNRLMAVGAVMVGVWAALRLSSLWIPVLPSPFPAGFERAAVAVSVGTALAALVWAYRRPTAA